MIVPILRGFPEPGHHGDPNIVPGDQSLPDVCRTVRLSVRKG